MKRGLESMRGETSENNGRVKIINVYYVHFENSTRNLLFCATKICQENEEKLKTLKSKTRKESFHCFKNADFD